MSTLTDAINFARANTQVDTNGLTDANGLIWGNASMMDIRRTFIENGIDAAQVQEAYRSITAGQGTYLYPSDMFYLKTMELNYQDTNQQNYKTANQIDVSNLPNTTQGGTSFDWMRVNQPITSPLYDDRGDWYEIFPTPVSANNLISSVKLFYYLQPTPYTTVSDTLAYPETLDYRILGKRIQMYYLRSLARIDEAKIIGDESMNDIIKLAKMLGTGEQQPQSTQGIAWTGNEF